MKSFLMIAFIILCWAIPGMAEEFAIIKDSLFGTQKIEIYRSQEEALKHFTGEGKVYRITRKEVPVKRVETRKKVEVTEYGWIIDNKTTAKKTK